jgi:DNA-binding CsgD family transcriptional regulator
MGCFRPFEGCRGKADAKSFPSPAASSQRSSLKLIRFDIAAPTANLPAVKSPARQGGGRPSLSTEASIVRRICGAGALSLSSRGTSRLLCAIESIYRREDLSTFHTGVFEAIAELVEDVVISVDSTRLGDGKAETRNTLEPIMSREMQSLFLKLFPENPMAPALQKGAQGLLEATDFISQRQFERTALYNEIMRPNGVRYHLLIPLKLPGHIVATSVNRHSRFSADEMKRLRLFTPHLVRAHVGVQTITRLRTLASDAPSVELLCEIGLTGQESHVMHWLIQGKRDCEIAQILDSKPRTVEKHVQHILLKFGVETRTAAAFAARDKAAARR